MARSFYYGTDWALYNGSMNFVQQIVDSPETYGLSQEQADAYQLVADAYANAYVTATTPATRTAGTVALKREWKLKIRRATARLAKIIDGTERVNDQEKVNLGLSLNHAGGPVQQPGKPDQFSAELSGIGSITLKWKCNHPTRTRGVIYFISRKIEGESDFVHIGHSGKKQYTDFTVPSGVPAVSYRVQAVRSTTASDYANFEVRFGVCPSMRSLAAAAMNLQNKQAA